MTAENSKEETLVLIATVANEPMARMWAESLENEGIPCLVKTTGGPGIAGVWAGPIVEHELWVKRSQAEAAEALLEDLSGPEEDLSPDE